MSSGFLKVKSVHKGSVRWNMVNVHGCLGSKLEARKREIGLFQMETRPTVPVDKNIF